MLGDLRSNALFFGPTFGGNPIFSQHLLCFLHPEVYVLLFPAFGIVSIIISVRLQLEIFARQSMIFAMSSISLIGLESDTRAYFTGVAISISFPTGAKIFNLLFAQGSSGISWHDASILSEPPKTAFNIPQMFCLTIPQYSHSAFP